MSKTQFAPGSGSSSDVVDLNALDYSQVENQLLYAVWAADYTVTFNENYGADPVTTDIGTSYGSVLYMPDNPTRTNFDFAVGILKMMEAVMFSPCHLMSPVV